jgi:hypothetical protein
MKQEARPVECALCSVKTGIHAMHPLYDVHGPEGRQLVLPASGAGFKRIEKRLAWCHSLCAQFISTNGGTKGSVYGIYDGGKCEEYGKIYDIGTEVSKEFDSGVFSGKVVAYHKEEEFYTVRYEDGDEEDLYEDELVEILASRKKPRISNDNNDEHDGYETGDSEATEVKLFATEAFCISTGEGYDQNIKEFRDLKCMICNSTDKHSLRIPVQCKAYDKTEFKEFRKCHKKTKGVTKPLCSLAVHVGCARYATGNYAGVKGKSLRMCYFYPGQKAGYEGEDVLYKNPVCDAFCRVHAREVMEHMKDAVKSAYDESDGEPESPQAKAAKVIAEKKKKNKFLDSDSDEDD